jgi:hypothetical protein
MNVIWADKNATGLLKLVPWFEYRHPVVFARIRVVAGVWLLILTAILYGYGRGGWWGCPAGTGRNSGLLPRPSLVSPASERPMQVQVTL